MIVLNRVARHFHHHLLETRHGPQHCELNIFGKRGADAIRIDQMRVQPLRLEEDLMPISIAEAVNFVLD